MRALWYALLFELLMVFILLICADALVAVVHELCR
jgi:hypothetical protein